MERAIEKGQYRDTGNIENKIQNEDKQNKNTTQKRTSTTKKRG